jgi:hypothetical protein
MATHSKAVPDGPSETPAVPIPRLLISAVPVHLAAGVAASMAALAGAPALAVATIVAATAASLTMSLRTIRMIRRMRLVEERRKHVRFQRDVAATINGHPARVTDLSLGGANLIAEMTEPPSVGADVELEMELATGCTTLRATVRRALERGYFARMGIEFAAGQRDEIVKLGLALLHSDVAADRAEREAEAEDAEGALARVA